MPVRRLSVLRQTSLRIDWKPLGLPSVKGDDANKRRRDRLQRQRHAQLLHHVGFVCEIEVHLDRRRAVHHVEAAATDVRHVAGHDAVALLGHVRHVFEAPLGRKADAEKADLEILADVEDFIEVLVGFGRGLVQGFERGARKLELAAGLEADVAAHLAVGALQGDDIGAFEDRHPAVAGDQLLHQGANAPRPLVGHRFEAERSEHEFLVLGADAPILLGLLACRDPPDKIGAAFDQRARGPLFSRRHAPSLFLGDGFATGRGAPQSPCLVMAIGQRDGKTSYCRFPVAQGCIDQ